MTTTTTVVLVAATAAATWIAVAVTTTAISKLAKAATAATTTTTRTKTTETRCYKMHFYSNATTAKLFPKGHAIFLSKHRGLFTQRHIVKSQKTRIFILTMSRQYLDYKPSQTAQGKNIRRTVTGNANI
jgi:hypothetical protein